MNEPSVQEHLERAGLAAIEDDLGAALVALLDAWRVLRAPAIADAIDKMTIRLGGDPIAGATTKERHADWLRRAQTKSPIVLGPLLAYAATNFPTREIGRDRIQAFERFADDPRIAAHIEACIKAGAASSSRTSWYDHRGTMSLVHRIRDTRRRRIIPEPRALTRPEERLLDDIDAILAKPRLPRGDELGLLKAIVADPNDLGARLVYADLLAMRGDARAELIVVQCSDRIDRGKEEAILRDRIADLLGPLHAVVEPSSCVFSRGFLDECAIVAPKVDVAVILDDTRWWTLRTLTLGPIAGTVTAALGNRRDAFRSLQTVRGPLHPVVGLRNLAVKKIEIARSNEAYPLDFLRRGGFESLTDLTIHVDSFYSYESAIVRRLERLHLHLNALSPIGDWVSRIPSNVPLPLLILQSPSAKLTLHRTNGIARALDLSITGSGAVVFAEVTRAISNTPRFLERISIDVASGVRVPSPVFNRIRAHLAATSPKQIDP